MLHRAIRVICLVMFLSVLARGDSFPVVWSPGDAWTTTLHELEREPFGREPSYRTNVYQKAYTVKSLTKVSGTNSPSRVG